MLLVKVSLFVEKSANSLRLNVHSLGRKTCIVSEISLGQGKVDEDQSPYYYLNILESR